MLKNDIFKMSISCLGLVLQKHVNQEIWLDWLLSSLEERSGEGLHLQLISF
jgi:hypothetical protein